MNSSKYRYGLLALVAFFLTAPAYAGASFDALFNKADAIRTSQPQEFFKVLKDLQALEERSSPEERMKIRLMRAHGYLLEGKSDSAIRDLEEVRIGAKDVEIRYRAAAMLANTYAGNRKFEQGLSTLNEMLPLVPEIKDRAARHHGLLAAGILYNRVGEFELGGEYASQVVADEPSGRNRCIAGNLIIESLQGQSKSLAEDQILGAVKNCELEREALLAGFSRTFLARKLHGDGKTTNAVALLERHLPDVEKTGYPVLVAEYLSMLAEYRLKMSDVQAAERHARAAVAQGDSISGSLSLVVAHRVLYEIANIRGNSVAALEQYKKYAEADKAYLNEIKTRELAYQLVRQQILQKTQQISLLDQENQVLQLQRKVDQQAAQNTRLIVILLVLLVASIGYWAFKIKRVQLSLKKMAETDALTGICNRHHFTLRAERALAECARNGEQAALIMFDLDHFKNINDRFGHGTGDWALKEVAEASKGFCRRIDVLGRLGGEEFAILMYGCDLRAAARVAEDCRVRLAQIETRETGHVFAITGSFGVTSSMQSGYSLAKLLSHADKQLYRAKHLGRNRVCVHENEQESVRAAGSNVLELPQREGRTEHLGA
jgi:diguanylate cyclase (GGDEF)-like protein